MAAVAYCGSQTIRPNGHTKRDVTQGDNLVSLANRVIDVQLVR